jgi:hypothetical protein
VLSPIATTKSSVLGLRLDNDRRAWVEATAIEQGVSVRAVFEALIDRARAEELAAVDTLSDLDYDNGYNAITVPDGTLYGRTHRDAPEGPVHSPSAPVLWLRHVAAFSGQVLGVAGSLVRALVEANSQHARACAHDNWRILSGSQE